MKRTLIKITGEMEAYIRINLDRLPIKVIARNIGIGNTRLRLYMKKNELFVPPEILQARKESTRFRVGQVAANKGRKMVVTEAQKRTQFQKGSIPHNTRKDGDISIKVDSAGFHYRYIRIRVNEWKMEQNIVWEAANGEIPKQYVLRHIDGNSLNNDLSNLALISRAENMKLNTIHQYPEIIKKSIRTLSKLKKQIKKNGQSTTINTVS